MNFEIPDQTVGPTFLSLDVIFVNSYMNFEIPDRTVGPTFLSFIYIIMNRVRSGFPYLRLLFNLSK